MAEPTDQELLSEAQAAMDRDDYEQALDLANRIVERSPANALGFALRARILSTQDEWGNKDLVLADFTRAIQLDPGSAEAYHGRGNAYRVIDCMDLAIEDLSRAIELRPDFLEAYMDRGFDYQMIKDHESAVYDLTEVIRLDPLNWEAYWHRGSSYGSLGDYARGLQDLRQAVSIEPSAAEALAELIQLYEQALTPPPPTQRTGCYIATACYGSYEHPSVLRLRRFRDERLLRSPVGRIVVGMYYTMSPPAARCLGAIPWLARAIRRYCLEPFVRHLT